MDFRPTVRQWEALQLLIDNDSQNILYGGGKGGGKTVLLCIWALIWSKMLCDLFGLETSKHPPPIGFLGRKQSVDFRKTTLETWMRVVPSEMYEIHRQDQEIYLFGGLCKLFFGGLDRQETINKFNSAELAFFALDQAEETTREDVSVLRGSLRLKINGKQPCYKELYTANPNDCWLKEDFIDHKLPGHYYVPALHSDNPYLPDNYVDTLNQAFRHSPPLLRAYRDGDWSALKSTNTLLSAEDINALEGLLIQFPETKKVVAVDPATSYDECVIYCMEDYKIIDEKIICGETDEMKIAGEVAALARKHNVRDVGGDTIGLGGGIFSRLEEIGDFRVHRINSAEKVGVPAQFLNRRAQLHWQAMQRVIDKRVHYPQDEELRRQLINITYEVVDSTGKIKITEKEKLKKVLGRSPDRAETFMYALDISEISEPHREKRGRRYNFDQEQESFNPATV